MTTPGWAGRPRKKRSRESSPPAEAPMPTTSGNAGRDAACSVITPACLATDVPAMRRGHMPPQIIDSRYVVAEPRGPRFRRSNPERKTLSAPFTSGAERTWPVPDVGWTHTSEGDPYDRPRQPGRARTRHRGRILSTERPRADREDAAGHGR